MQKHSPTPDASADAGLPPGLEERIALIESQGQGDDFDAFSWFWLAALGVVLPAALLIAGWWL